MLLALDFGHTALKAALADDNGNIQQKWNVTHGSPLEEYREFLKGTYDGVVLTSPQAPPEGLIQAFSQLSSRFIHLGPETPVPLKNLYRTPETLGYDRIAAAIGAWKHFPDQNSLVIDLGTCINYEVVTSEGEYAGGAISPGYAMRFKAMHTFTGNLPLVEREPGYFHEPGTDTASCLLAGVSAGMVHEMEGFINSFILRYGNMNILLTGGDAPHFANQLKNNIFARPDLVMEGLFEILRFNL